MAPALLLKDQEGAGKLRIDELLSHRVGLPYNTYDRQLESEEPYPMLVEKLGEISPMCAVGDCYAYQNVAFSLIGDVVFAATGDFFSHQVEKRLFHPLGMTSATYGREALFGSKSYALPHIGTRGTLQSVIPKETYYHVPPAAGVNASANDLGQWLLAQLGHRPDVLSPELVALLHAPQVATPGELSSSPWRRARLRTAAYALGWRVFDYSGHDMIFHAGAVQGYRAMLGLLPNEDFGIAIVWNGETAIPAGLFPTLIDQRLGLPAQDWLELSKFNPRAKKAKARRR
jgi:beta-lactamase class C